MIQLIYVSVACAPFSHDELLELLGQARRKNTSLGVTGMLLHEEGTFLQILEGAVGMVGGLYRTIRDDPRHDRHTVLWRRDVEEPTFAGWSMGFADADRDSLRGMPGYCDFFHPSYFLESGRADGSKAYAVLSRFRKGAFHR